MPAIPLLLAGAAAVLLFADRKPGTGPDAPRVIDATPNVRVRTAPTKPKLRALPSGKPKPATTEAAAVKQAAQQAAKLEAAVSKAPVKPKAPGLKPAPSVKTQAKGSQLSSQLRKLSPAKAPPSNKRKAPPGTNIALARSTAKDVAKHILKTGKKYTRKVLAQFQLRAGLKPDGLYGPMSAEALRYFGAAAPKPLFNVNTTAHYVPPTV